jgi:hypothetical protein
VLSWLVVAGGATCGACSSEGRSELTILLDSTPAPHAVEALVLPADPSAILDSRPVAAAARRPATADSVARYRRLADSSEHLDRRFQLLRDSLNREARALDAEDRRSRAYADRFFVFRRRALEAETIRHSRDGLRSRTASMGARLAAALRAGASRDDDARRRSALDALAAGGRRPRTIPLDARVVTGALAPGPWWIGVAPRGGVPARFDHVVLRPGVHDTLRLSGEAPR